MNGEVEQVYQKYMAVFHDTLSGGEWVGLDAVRGCCQSLCNGDGYDHD